MKRVGLMRNIFFPKSDKNAIIKIMKQNNNTIWNFGEIFISEW